MQIVEKKEKICQRFVDEVNTIISKASESVIGRKNEWGAWGGRIVNLRYPQNYVDVEVMGYETQNMIAYNINIIKDNKVIGTDGLEYYIDLSNYTKSVKNGAENAVNKFLECFIKNIEELNIKDEKSIELFSPYKEHGLEEHYSMLEKKERVHFQIMIILRNHTV